MFLGLGLSAYILSRKIEKRIVFETTEDPSLIFMSRAEYKTTTWCSRKEVWCRPPLLAFELLNFARK
jgi:hypothetical protein